MLLQDHVRNIMLYQIKGVNPQADMVWDSCIWLVV